MIVGAEPVENPFSWKQIINIYFSTTFFFVLYFYLGFWVFSQKISFSQSGKVKHELRVQIHELQVQIHELRVQNHELRVQIYESED